MAAKAAVSLSSTAFLSAINSCIMFSSLRYSQKKGLHQQKMRMMFTKSLSCVCFCCICATSCLKICLPVVVFMSILLFQKIYFKNEKGVLSWLVHTKATSSIRCTAYCFNRVRMRNKVRSITKRKMMETSQ